MVHGIGRSYYDMIKYSFNYLDDDTGYEYFYRIFKFIDKYTK